MGRISSPTPTSSTALRAVLFAVAASRIARGARREPPLGPGADGKTTATVVIPARNESGRIGPCLESVLGAGPGVQVLVVDDGSTDDTRAAAEAAGAGVVDAGPLPAGWAGKAHALQVGLEVAATPVVVFVDADTRLQPGAIGALVERLDGHALITAATRVDAPDPLGRATHSAMLASLVIRTVPPGVPARRPQRVMANGQCMVLDRAAVLAAGGFEPVADHLIEDVALARHLAATGLPVAFVDGTALVEVVGYGGPLATLRGWGRSFALPGVDGPIRRTFDLAIVWSALALPAPRLLAGRGDTIDVAALGLRVGLAAATSRAFARRGPALALSLLADIPSALALTAGGLRPSRTWRDRTY